MADKLISFNRELQLVSYAIYLHENKTTNIYAVQINSNIFPIIFINRAIKKEKSHSRLLYRDSR